MLRRSPRRANGTAGRYLLALIASLVLIGLALGLIMSRPPAQPSPQPAAAPPNPPAQASEPIRLQAPPPREAAAAGPSMHWDELQAPGFCPADGRIRLPTVESLLRVASAGPAAPAEVGEAARMLTSGDRDAARRRLHSVRRQLADQPEAALAYALLQAHQPELTTAIEALDVYLARRPDDQAISQLRARLALQADLQRDDIVLAHDGISLLVPADFGRRQADALEALVLDALDQAAALTATRRRDSLTVVVYRDRSELLATSCVRTWAVGLFDGTIRLTADGMGRPALWRKQVRHEVLHAQLAARVPKVPKWFNEGLAQCFAGQFGPAHVRTYERMLANQTWIPFSSLEGSFIDFGDPQDAGMAYHQSLAMVQMMVDQDGRSAIGMATSALLDGHSLEPLLAAMFPQGGGHALLAFLARWRDEAWVPRVHCADEPPP